MKQIHFILSSLAASFMLGGCATTTSQPNPSPLQQATSLKEYIALKRGGETINYNVIAEREYQSMIEYRTYDEAMNVADARDIMDVLDDAKGYCESIKGKSVYGDKAIQALNARPTLLSLDYVSYKSAMREQGLGKYEGFYQCLSSYDGFSIVSMKDNVELRQSSILGNKRDLKETYSRFYLIQHDKAQSLGLKTWLKGLKYAQISTKYASFEDLLDLEKNSSIFPWRYERIIGAQKYCTYHGGELFVSNALTQFKPVTMDEYLFMRLETMNTTTINVFMNQETVTCKNKTTPAQSFTLIHTDKQLEYKKGE
ncbi:hypothetical protein [Sulfurospirillum halorespirans]|uniref:Lipoprotein n=1 Tax=Sulfurospirillum halorespirans DSM 13726 TaxID=1193502 RepID=A0A1D7TGT0_9BACT|nr:hypothetical protein [Sulfurospirillum halorespirans]AOO64211.1 hypothetical protein SHALO_0415 [Sulfurospirillum halorespirans DSM 13726]